jgi:branched-chain amino acid transport system ATP-binding protein
VSAGPEQAEPTGQAVLELDHLSLSFGGLRALSELDLHVADREVVSVIGPNGAGKTTVFNVITGVYRPSAGRRQVRRGVDRGPGAARHHPAGHRPHVPEPAAVPEHVGARERHGGHLRGHQGAGVESILRLPRARREEREVRALAEDVLSFFGQRLRATAGTSPRTSLSYANRRRLEIARAIATRPRLLLLDEPAAGMNPNETHEVTELIGRLRDERGFRSS